MNDHSRRRSRVGTTLVELLVVLLVLSIMAGVTGLAFHALHTSSTSTEAALDQIAKARRQAIETGHDVTLLVEANGGLHAVTAHADGRVLADSLPAIEPLSGRSTSVENEHAHQ
jgi:Tfp pilus assembly protein FimT